jgi:DNA-binding response OmpR family regulator
MRQQMRELVDETYAMSARRKVLIFDEDVEALDQHAEPFEAQGIEVHRCTTVEAAMRCLQREDFDLALVDQGSSGFEGRRVIGYLVRYNLRTPFIVLARRADAEWYEQGLALGAVDCLNKPVMPVEMNWIIRRFLGRTTSLAK